jgi:hypothetical protein
MQKNPSYTRDIQEMVYTSLTPPSNSRWINNTEFGEKEPMLLSSLGLGEEVIEL